MDIVLEVFDTFLFDPIYATLLPAQTAPFAANATLSGLKGEPTGFVSPTGWEYKPATDYFSITPGPSAYMSQWARDDWKRQAVSLYLITWYAIAP
jgi:Delta7-sterol 5-desaturase